MSKFDNLPDLHRRFMEHSVPKLRHDPRILGVAVGGSILLDAVDEFSDIDLVVYVDPEHYEEVLEQRLEIVGKIGSLIQGFTGEHVGEPRLLICLYGPPLLHIDYKFVSMSDIRDKVENPIIVWERDHKISNLLFQTPAEFPQPDPEWIEDRFWIWVHYVATKIGRGEIFEAIDGISFMRVTVLGPLFLMKKNARPQGVRKLEFHADSTELENLKETIATYDAMSTIKALRKTIEMYTQLKSISGNQLAETSAIEYLNQIEKRLR